MPAEQYNILPGRSVESLLGTAFASLVGVECFAHVLGISPREIMFVDHHADGTLFAGDAPFFQHGEQKFLFLGVVAGKLVAIRWRPTSEGKVQIEAKDDLKKRLGRSPDRADAVTMALYRFAAGGREPGDYGVTI